MELKKRRWECRYVNEYLAVGEAPEQLRNCFQQRSRWCKGHFQIMLSSDHCPLFQQGLPPFQRLMYCTGVWSYVVGAITTPMFIIIPLVTIWGGVFPIVVSWWAAMGLTVYMSAQFLVMNYVHRARDLKALWFANIANSILWWTFVKACWRAAGGVFGRSITFKTTAKGVGNMLAAKALGDLWMPATSFISLFTALCFGLYKVFTGPTVVTTLSISIIWIAYNAIPPYLLLHYNYIGKGTTLRAACSACYILTSLCSLVAIILIWLVYPAQYDYAKVIGASLSFYDAERLGPIDPASPNTTFPIAWRNASLMWEKGPKALGFGALTGGWMTGGEVGTVKMTAPAAFATAMLAWGLVEFPKGYAKANATGHALATLRWSNDYLLKTFTKDRKRSSRYPEYLIVYQVGNLTVDKAHWTRPEDMEKAVHKRPAYYVTTYNGTSDLAGQLVGAFASSSLAFRESDPAYADKLATAAMRLYGAATRHTGRYTKNFLYKCAPVDPNSQVRAPPSTLCPPADQVFRGAAVAQYNSTSYRDDLAWAAAWMYRATQDRAYLDDAYKWWVAHSNEEGQADQRLLVDWDHLAWPSTVLMAQITDDMAFHEAIQGFLAKWLCTSSTISYTDLGRAFNHYDPRTGTTMNAAALSIIYGNSIKGNASAPAWEAQPYNDAARSQRYVCWTRKQMRYILGDHSPSLVTGLGSRPPTRVSDRAASCPKDKATKCTAVNGLYTPAANPHILKGALISAPKPWDFFEDARTSNDTRVGVDQNAGFTTSAAGLNEAAGTYDQCLQGIGLLQRDKVICDGVVLYA
jgi:endoglucanase